MKRNTHQVSLVAMILHSILNRDRVARYIWLALCFATIFLTGDQGMAQGDRIDPTYYAIDKGDISSLEQGLFWLAAVLLFGLAFVLFIISFIKTRDIGITVMQMRGWMERQANVLTNSISHHCYRVTWDYYVYYKVLTERKLKDRTLTHAQKSLYKSELKIVQEKLHDLETDPDLTSGRWFQIWDLPAPASFKEFQLYLTPWSFIRGRTRLMRQNLLDSAYTLGDGTVVWLDSTNWDYAVRVCERVGWSMEYIMESQGTYPKHIRRMLQRADRQLGLGVHQRKGPPMVKLQALYECGVSFVADLRGPAGGQKGAVFASAYEREQAMEALAKQFVEYLKGESYSAKPLDTPWARVYATLGYILASETQFDEIAAQKPHLNLWDMRLSVEETNRRAHIYAILLRKLAYSKHKDISNEVVALACAKGWEFGTYDSLNWYRGDRNFQQSGTPMVTDVPKTITGDTPLNELESFISGRTPPQYASVPDSDYWEWAQKHFGPSGEGVRGPMGKKLRAIQDILNMSEEEQAMMRTLRPGKVRQPRMTAPPWKRT